MTHSYKTHGVCSRQIDVTIDDDSKKIKSVKFHGGCAGNTKGIEALVVGMDAASVVEKFEGVTCGPRPTSCPDQLAKAIKETLLKSENKE